MRQAAVVLAVLALALAAAGGARAGDAWVGTPSAPLDHVAFQGSAMLIFYYSGIVESLTGCKAIVPGRTHISGLSGGAYTAVATTLGLSGREQFYIWTNVTAACAIQYARVLPPQCYNATAECKAQAASCTGHLNAALKEVLLDNLTDEDAKQITGKVRIYMSQLDASRSDINGSASWAVKSWRNKYDLAGALTGTNYIPCWAGPDVYTTYRNQPVIDGAFSTGFKELCSSTGSLDKCLKIGTWVVGDMANQTCDPELCVDLAQGNCTGGEPRTDRVLKLYKNERYTSEWVLESYRLRCNADAWEGMAPYPLADYVPQWSTMPDIHPGKYNDLPSPAWNGGRPLLACQWQEYALKPPTSAEFPEVVFQTGVADGAKWCKANGYTSSG